MKVFLSSFVRRFLYSVYNVGRNLIKKDTRLLSVKFQAWLKVLHPPESVKMFGCVINIWIFSRATSCVMICNKVPWYFCRKWVVPFSCTIIYERLEFYITWCMLTVIAWFLASNCQANQKALESRVVVSRVLSSLDKRIHLVNMYGLTMYWLV